ncbi:MAG: hypothetical protein AAGA99_00670 [Actinomycetota bacterium]
MSFLFSSVGYEQLTGITSATGITPSLYQYTQDNGDVSVVGRRVLLQATGANVRWRDDGTDPTASVGMVVVAGGAPQLYEGPVENLRFIQESGGAVLNVTVYA